jgi:phosphatidylglycerol:prolipoprotein diacylglycerol transferase
MIREVRRRGFDVDKVSSVLTWALFGALLGARLFTIPAHIGTMGYGWDDVIGVTGSYSILGGYAGGILVGALRMRMLRLPVLPLMDMAAPGLAIGAVVGRIGDLAIVEHLGSATTFFLGYTVKPGYDIASQHDDLECIDATADAGGICGTFHHTALYDLIGAAVLLIVLLWLRRHWGRVRYGQLFAVWMIWYGFQRFLIDFTRLTATESGDPQIIADGVIGPLTGSQWGALGLGLLGVILLLVFRRNPVVSDEQDALYRTEAEGDTEDDGDTEPGDAALTADGRDATPIGDGKEATLEEEHGASVDTAVDTTDVTPTDTEDDDRP